MSIEREHLEAALAEAEAVVRESEHVHARSAAASWWGCCVILRRFLDHPDAFPADPPVQ
ncbi:hypothetical protein [Micrococcus luteus]|mgnify:FL=1|uniref:hypothetical protein n=1 Tax=Micrococcus luteus TaxID=1270 RepID=UPI00132FD99E|nr:hypothetical protein [Micrococcus luteus]MCT1858146.1 hypothetical protein [Micrococcus luteus]MCV7618695.1 hypothetical protein [Micrococcus luteus]